MIYQTIDSSSQFSDAFHAAGRGEQFSYAALQALYNFIDELYTDDTGYNLDVVALCCEWCEYESAREAVEQINREQLQEESEALEFLQNQYTVIEVSGGGVLVSY
jgi:hypothetical protein